MKKKFIGILFLAVCTGLISGCTYIANVTNSEINGAVSQVPVHVVKLNDSSTFDFSLNFGYNEIKNIRIQKDSAIQNSNWQTGDYFFETHLDFKFLENMSLFGGIDFSNTSKGILTGGILGLSIFGETRALPVRFDFGFKFNTTHRKADYNYMFNDIFHSSFLKSDSVNGMRTSIDYFASFVINTDRSDWIFNPFFRAAYIHQNILYLQSGKNDDNSINYNFSLNVNNIILSTGCSIDISDNIYLIAGINCNILYLPENMKTQSNFMPFVNFHYKI